MNNCCNDLLEEIKDLIKLRENAYRANHEFAKAHACKLLHYDTTEKYQLRWDVSENSKVQSKIDYLIRTDGHLRELIDALQKRVEKLEAITCKHPGPVTKILLSDPPKMQCKQCGEIFPL